MKIKTGLLTISLLAGVMISAIACRANPAGDVSSDLPHTPTVAQLTEISDEQSEIDAPERNQLTMPVTPQASSNSAVPNDILSLMIEDLAEKLNLEPEVIVVVEARETVWKNGALGCPKPGRSYTMAEVPGYYVVLEANGQQHRYHASRQSGHFFECESNTQSPDAPNSR